MRILFAAAAILLTICTDALGQAYRWVDQDGRVHYTQTPPPPVAAKNFPVTLHTLADCGSPCDQARALLVSRAVPFTEASPVTQKDADEVKRLSGKNDLPLMVVGTQVQTGFHEGLLNALLDSAGYPSSAPPAPIETLRKMNPAARAQPRQGAGASAEPAPDAAAR